MTSSKKYSMPSTPSRWIRGYGHCRSKKGSNRQRRWFSMLPFCWTPRLPKSSTPEVLSWRRASARKASHSILGAEDLWLLLRHVSAIARSDLSAADQIAGVANVRERSASRDLIASRRDHLTDLDVRSCLQPEASETHCRPQCEKGRTLPARDVEREFELVFRYATNRCIG